MEESLAIHACSLWEWTGHIYLLTHDLNYCMMYHEGGSGREVEASLSSYPQCDLVGGVDCVLDVLILRKCNRTESFQNPLNGECFLPPGCTAVRQYTYTSNVC